MTINQCDWPTLQYVPCPAANASTNDLHSICLPEQINQGTMNSGNLEWNEWG
jgi:hypothetical protein